MTGRFLCGIAACAVAFSLPQAAVAKPKLEFAYAATPYTLAAKCDLTQPIAFLNLTIHNAGDAPSHPHTFEASDSGGALSGTQPLAPLAPGATLNVQIPLRHVPSNASPLAGAHPISVKPGETELKTLNLQIPASLCPPVAVASPSSAQGENLGVSVGQSTAATRSGAALSHATLPSPTPNPLISQNTNAQVRRALAPAPGLTQGVNVRSKSGMVADFSLAAPTNARAANGAQDCFAHVGAIIGALICPDMVKSGRLLVVWEWQPKGGTGDVDGYRVYRVDGGNQQLVVTQANKKAVTLADIPLPAGGYYGKCYAVTAFVSTNESTMSSPLCAGGGSVAKTVTLQSTMARWGAQDRNNSTFRSGIDDSWTVGFSYIESKDLFGDNYENIISRLAVAFDMSPFAHRKLVSAKLMLDLVTSTGQGNNHSCTTDVGTGTEFWWKNSPGTWIDGQFGYQVAPTDTGPVISADVTQIVAPWLRGEPNYGFVLKNADENLGAFTNKACYSKYSRPVLEVTYY